MYQIEIFDENDPKYRCCCRGCSCCCQYKPAAFAVVIIDLALAIFVLLAILGDYSSYNEQQIVHYAKGILYFSNIIDNYYW